MRRLKTSKHQLLKVLPSTMTTLTRFYYQTSLIVVLLNQMDCVSSSNRSGFITLGRYKTNDWLDEVETAVTEPSDVLNEKIIKPAYNVYTGPYRWRYQPRNPMPRLFWHKFPQQQQEEPTTTMTAMTTTVGPVTNPTDEPIQPEVTEKPTETPMMTPETEPPQPETEPPPATTTTTTKTSITTSSTTTSAPPIPSTTFTTIMKPSSHFPFNLAEKLKNLFVYSSPSQLNLIQKYGAKGKTKSKGFLSLFEVIKFANTKCSVSMGDIRSMEGICYHDFECKSLGGISTERCGEGLGVCCIFLTGCGDTVGQSVAYFESPNYPQPIKEIMICVLIVHLRQHVQQLRLDFLMFELNRPTDGNCEDDQFIVSGQNINFMVPVLCGINTGQHIYIHAGNSPDGKIYLSFFAKVPVGSRAFNIKISQLEDNLAPDNCLQYYNELEGVVKSFNYDIDGTLMPNKEATYLNNLNYVICIKRGKEYCTVSYIVEQIGGSADQLDFQIVNKDEEENDLVPDGQAGAGIFNCPDDFLGINQVRLCGERFNDGTANEDFTMHAPVRNDAAGPIILPFRSDEAYVGRGFRLAFRQELCL